MGPAEVLLPFVVKNEPRRQRRATSAWSSRPAASARSACAVVMGQRGIPRRDITFMYLAWTLATVAVAGYGLATAVWQLMLASLAFNALETAGTIVWATAKQRHVPPALLGRVSSLDWLISIGLLPAVVRAHRPGQRRHRRAGDADRRRRDRRRRDVRRAAAAGHAGRRGATRRSPARAASQDDGPPRNGVALGGRLRRERVGLLAISPRFCRVQERSERARLGS